MTSQSLHLTRGSVRNSLLPLFLTAAIALGRRRTLESYGNHLFYLTRTQVNADFSTSSEGRKCPGVEFLALLIRFLAKRPFKLAKWKSFPLRGEAFMSK